MCCAVYVQLDNGCEVATSHIKLKQNSFLKLAARGLEFFISATHRAAACTRVETVRTPSRLQLGSTMGCVVGLSEEQQPAVLVVIQGEDTTEAQTN